MRRTASGGYKLRNARPLEDGHLRRRLMTSAGEARRSRPSPALLVAVVALAAALAGTAVADPTGSVSGINKRKVKRIAKKQINKLAPGLSVAHADTAGSAKRADTANTAGGAANADKVDGRDASAFAAAGEVHTPVRRVFNDPAPGDQLVDGAVNLAFVGPFTLKGTCVKDDEFNQDEAAVRVEGTPAFSFTAVRTSGGVITDPATTSTSAVGALSSTNEVEGGHFVAAARNGQVVSGSASAEVGDAAGHCIVSVTALGP
jgi:hypothetical protein